MTYFKLIMYDQSKEWKQTTVKKKKRLNYATREIETAEPDHQHGLGLGGVGLGDKKAPRDVISWR